ncbi:MAG: PQQ-binding-like beta-propeller repeat protein [Bryobacteraceae bacterium]|nr:PQQ-binding-like beta-propeller repeat protein [Bryobacteraceae bacterium]
MSLARVAYLALCFLMAVPYSLAADWPDWRGPNRDGVSAEKDLPSSWSPAGENLRWKAPFPGRSTPIVMGDRLFAFNGGGEGPTLQERVVCLDANTGKLIWEYRHNVFHSDVPKHRIAWSSPVGDPETGNIYSYGVAGMLTALSRDGKLLWQRSLIEEFGIMSTHGGRTVSPIIEGDLVIISAITSGWGDQARAAHRFMAFNKTNGDCVWVSTAPGRALDTTYSTPVAANIDGARLIIAGAGDGAVHALKAQTGEEVWRYEMAKRGINTAVIMNGTTAIVSHSEENLDTSEMGLLAAVDAAATGAVGPSHIKWAVKGFLGGFSSPVTDGDTIYQVDNGSVLHAFDVNTGKQLWNKVLGTIQKGALALADGKLYTGTENGKFYILKPSRAGCEIVDEVLLGTEEHPEHIIAAPAISHGKVFVVSDGAMYCFGKKSDAKFVPKASSRPVSTEAPAFLQVTPTEIILKQGETAQFRARLFDAKGVFIREAEASWAVERLNGEFGANGKFTAAAQPSVQAGLVKATVDGLAGTARARIVPPLPWNQDFESMKPGPLPPFWVSAGGKFEVRAVDGGNVLVKLSDNPATYRARVFMGPPEWHDYTVQVDIRASERRRQMGDPGVVAQRHGLVLFGNDQRLEIHPWQADPTRTVRVPFEWKKDTWYRMKLRVENLPGGKVRALGKVWPVADPEPDAWTIEREDPIPNHEGSPGLYANAPAEIFFDNLKVTTNE